MGGPGAAAADRPPVAEDVVSVDVAAVGYVAADEASEGEDEQGPSLRARPQHSHGGSRLRGRDRSMGPNRQWSRGRFRFVRGCRGEKGGSGARRRKRFPRSLHLRFGAAITPFLTSLSMPNRETDDGWTGHTFASSMPSSDD